MPCSTRLSSLIGSVSEKINNLLLDRVVCESGGWEVLCPSVVFFLKLLKMRNQENQRREKKRRISDRDRWLMSLDEERRELWSQLQQAPLKELEEPYQKGWERYYVLSEQAKRRKDGEELEMALSFVRTYQRCGVNPFMRYRYQSKRMVAWEHNLAGIRPRQILSSKIPESLLKYFRLRLREPLTTERLRELIRSGWQGRFWFRYPEYAISVVRPYLITHSRVALPDVESRLTEIERYLQMGENAFRLDRLKDIGVNRWNRVDQELKNRKNNSSARKEMLEAMQEFNESNWNQRRRPFVFLN